MNRWSVCLIAAAFLGASWGVHAEADAKGSRSCGLKKETQCSGLKKETRCSGVKNETTSCGLKKEKASCGLKNESLSCGAGAKREAAQCPAKAEKECPKKADGCRAAQRGTPRAVKSAQEVCPIMGGKIDKNLYVDHDGKRVYVCCAGCVSKVQADPAKVIQQLEKEGIVPAPAPKTKS